MGAVFMQLTYNNQSLLATGCYETHDSGVTRMGREVIKEMNRVGVIVDGSTYHPHCIALHYKCSTADHPYRRRRPADVLLLLPPPPAGRSYDKVQMQYS